MVKEIHVLFTFSAVVILVIFFISMNVEWYVTQKLILSHTVFRYYQTGVYSG